MNALGCECEFSTPSRQIPLVKLEMIGSRPEPVVPDGVWIEIQGNASVNKAVINAMIEEKRIENMLRRKNERLQQFQQNLQKRVAFAVQAHRKFIAESQSLKMETEREMLVRSASAAELSTPKKNRCSYNVNPVNVIDGTGKLSTSLNLSSQELGDPMLHISEDASSTCFVNDVRKKLIQRTIIPKTEDFTNVNMTSEHLPGGLWGVGVSRDKSTARTYDKVKANENIDNCDTASQHSSIEVIDSATSNSDNVTLASLQESIASSLVTSQRWLYEVNKTFIKSNEKLKESESDNPLKANVHFQLSESISNKCDPIVVTAVKSHETHDVVKSSLPNNAKFLNSRQKNAHHNKVVNNKNGAYKAAGRFHEDLQKRVIAGVPPLVKPGVYAHTLKLADERSKWLSRRVFADAERERSREQARWKEHQHRVAKLREEKERERAEVEEKSREQVEAVERANEQIKIDLENEKERKRKKSEDLAKKQQKTDRFVAALYAQLQERIAKHKIQLPPLCMCGTTFWDTNPKFCATNCIFHRNPRAYAKALEAVLAAVERNMGPVHEDILQKSTVSLGFVDEDAETSDYPSARSTFAKSIEMSFCSDS